MPDTQFQSLSAKERLDALGVAAERSGHQAYLLEKDIWAVHTLAALFEAPFGNHLTFKGGTSLSKAYGVIQRFSEDLDITYDLRKLVPDLVFNAGPDPLPPSRSEERRWRNQITKSLKSWLNCEALPTIKSSLSKFDVSVQFRLEDDCIYVVYEPLSSGSEFVKPEVKVEFGARSTGEPRSEFPITCDAAEYLPDLLFPTATPHVMSAERTFWEKATLAHVFCRQERMRGERLSRHWHDLVRLDDHGYAGKALDDHETAIRVAFHKNAFFRENDTSQTLIDYLQAVSGNLQLIPNGKAYGVLAADYQMMLDSGMLLNTTENFDNIIQRCAEIQKRANDESRATAVLFHLET